MEKLKARLRSLDISFNRWPPVISHLMAFVLGILAMSYEKENLVAFTSQPGEVEIHPSKTIARKIKRSQVAHHAYLLKIKPSKKPCLWHPHPLSLIWDHQQNVKIVVRTKEITPQLMESFKPRGGRFLKFSPTAESEPCEGRGKVVYE